MTLDRENEYSFKKYLGSGNVGVVYEVINKSDEKGYALKKILDCGQKTDLNFGQLKECKCDFLVNIHDFFKRQGDIFLVMDLCSKGSLRSILGTPIALENVVKIFSQLVKGLKYLHVKNIIHGNLKPENILFVNKEKLEVKIGDFGLKDLINTSDPHSLITVEWTYFPPEVVNAQSLSLKTDIWPLGLIVYEMMFGKLPFRSKDDIADEIASDDEFPPIPFGMCDGRMSNLISQMLRKRPEDRPTAANIESELEVVQKHLSPN